MTDPADLPPRDIPEDLVAYALIGGPWLARAYFSLRLLAFIIHTLAPWHAGSYLEIRRRLRPVVGEIKA